MPLYNLIQYSKNYSKKCRSLWQYFRDEPDVDGNGAIIDFTKANPAKSFNSKVK